MYRKFLLSDLEYVVETLINKTLYSAAGTKVQNTSHNSLEGNRLKSCEQKSNTR